MFYSHEILTSRKYGVATIWLVATLGAKSGTKKVTKKAILDVNIKKAVETIMEPEAPMALRLQSNLLYGVSKVHDQQWEYLLSDAQAAQNGMRALLRIVRDDGLDPDAGKARPDQLILMDDPAFIPENGLPIFDMSMLDLNHNGDSQRSSQSMLSVRHRSGSVSSSQAGSAFGLNIPSSSGGGGSYQLPNFNDPFRDSSVQKKVGLGLNIFDEEMMLLGAEDDLFDFDADGQFREIPASEREARRAGSVLPQGRLGSDSAASGRVRKELEDALAGRGPHIYDPDGEFHNFNYDDDMGMLPDAEPFPVMTGGLGAGDRALNRDGEDLVASEEESSESADAPAKRKKAKINKKKLTDQTLQLSNLELNQWQRGYVEKMAADTLVKTNNKAKTVAKKNAFHYVFGAGLNGVGNGFGSAKLPSPLEMFSGEALRAALIGKPAPEADIEAKRGTKRALEDDEEKFETPSKRTRGDEVARGYDDDGVIINYDYDDGMINSHEQSVEMGRDAPSALADHPSSAMPWNVSASLHSHQRGQSSSIQGRTGILGSQLGSMANRRLTSASPLVGRGTAIPGDLEDFSQQMGDDDPMVMYGRDDDDFASGSQAPAFGRASAMSSSQAPGLEEFELFGAAAGVDTQTAGQSQWVAQALDRESNNFFEYVKNTISEKMGDELADEDPLAAQELGQKSVTFEELFVPEMNSAVVAAQAFYHVLCLATKHRVWVEQTLEDMEPYGEIRVGVIA